MGFWTSGHNLSQETLIFCYILCFFQQHSSNVLIPQKLKAKYTKTGWAIFKSTNRTKISPNHTVQSVCALYVNRQLQHNNVYYIGFQMKNGTRPTHMAARFRCPGSQRSSHVNSLKVTRFLFYTQSSKISYIFTNKQTTIKIHTLQSSSEGKRHFQSKLN